MKIRTITGAILVAIAIPILIFSEYLIYPIVLAALAAVAVFELLRVMKTEKKYAASVPAYLIAIVLPLMSYYFTRDSRLEYLLFVSAVLFSYMLYLMCIAVFSHGSFRMSKAAEVFLAVTYVSASFTSLSTVRYIEHGLFSVMLAFVAAWCTDVMAYFGGSLFGKHKLIPDVSPKKTVEGAVSGIFGAVAACLIYGLLIELFTEVSANYLSLAIIGLILSFISQLGDLAASLIKREYGVKDYGSILPGHGGIMDRFDSVLAVSTPLMAICILLPPFN